MRSKIPRTIESFVGGWSRIIPQASDDANLDYGIFGYLGAISLYIFYALYKDARNGCRIENNCCDENVNTCVEPHSQDVHPGQHPKNNHVGSFTSQYDRVHIVRMTDEQWFAYRRWRDMKARCTPQSEEIKEEVADGDITSQNVKFIDTHPGYHVSPLGEFDAIRDAPLARDASLEEFFSRPLRILTKSWGVNTTLYETFNPWQLYWENLRVINRIANYKLLRAKLCLKVTINGNAFHYGRAILSYNPLPTLDEMTVDRAFIDADNVAASQRPHLYLDPTNSQGGEMCLPFFYHKNALDITGQDWRELGECVLNGLTTLKHANGAVDTVTVNVFAWATDVKFAIPTQIEPGAIDPQADEYGKGPISRPASVIANVASKMSMIPTIGPFARATEIGASAVGAVATLFGYSRPVMLSKAQFKPHPKGDMAVTDTEDDLPKLSVTAKQELTLDPRTTGLGDIDEMSINYIAKRESYLTAFDWEVGTTTETLLWNSIVDPALHRIQADELHFPASCFASMPFDYWRGAMEFRFQVVCSKYHKGRLKVVYDPSGNPAGDAEYNTAYTTIVDIADTTDFTIKCGWGQATTYRERIPLGTNQSTMFDTTELSYTTPGAPYGNGTIAVYVVNELTVPNTTDNNDIEINVFVKMCDDFEVAQPDGNAISQLRLTTSSQLTQPEPQAEEIIPHADEAAQSAQDNEADETNRMDSAPMGTKVVNTTGNEIDLTDYTNHVHFGESIRSFRQLIKRYNLHEVLSFDADVGSGAGNKVFARWIRNILPFEPGYTSEDTDVTYITFNGFYYYSQMTLLRYLTTGYGGWRGGVRWLVDSSTSGTAANGDRTQVILGREREGTTMDNDTFIETGPYTNPNGQGTAHIRYAESNGQSGAILHNYKVNPISSAEIPYYSLYRFSPAKERVTSTGPNTAMPTYRIIYTGNVAEKDYLTTWCAAAEDFNCFFYLGPPIFYRDIAPPIE
nr:MAG: hypothetical protein 2 [Salisharnavirus sp.]